MFDKIRSAIADDNEMPKEWQRLGSLIFLLFAVIITFPEYTRERQWWFDSKSDIRPTFISAAIAICLVSPLYLREILKWNKSVYGLVSSFLITWVFASFVSASLIQLKGILGTVNFYLILMAISLSWLGIRGVAGVSWIVVFILAIYNIRKVSLDMDIWGFLFVVFSFLGLCLHSGVNPGELFKGLKEEYGPGVRAAKETVAGDISEIKTM